ncbi:MAG TPA: type II toxin-antitoxin system VapC family toxin [Bryobacteraceae bacterium]|nr:type II toxin-antitoxin system VapC family toxin [Bryobacteraceae bacterium]
MRPRLLLDTHIVVRWLTNPKKLSREQSRVLESAIRQAEPLTLSAISLLEIAVLGSGGKLGLKVALEELFEDLQSPVFQILPLTYEVAAEVVSLGVLRDPADRAIVATARVHRLRLVTSDQRITESKLVAVVA